MNIDLHIHTRDGSDGNLSIEEVFREAAARGINFMSITDHDSVNALEKALTLAEKHKIALITGIELNVTFQYPGSKAVSLDFLGYRFDINNKPLRDKLKILRERREARALEILEKLNAEFDKTNIPRLNEQDIRNIEANVDGAFGRPHIADYLVKKGIVKDRQAAFDKYLVKCDVPKYPLSLAEASSLIRDAGGVLVHAHPGDPRGTSLASLSPDVQKQTEIIENYMLEYLDGVECWHPGHHAAITNHYAEFARKHNLLATGGSDCHQKPIIMGSVFIPDNVATRLNP